MAALEFPIIDSHAHLDYQYDQTTEELLAGCASNGISHVITIAAEPDSLERTEKIASLYPNIFHTSGIHPHDADKLDDAVFARLVKASQSPKCVAIGELGLDYFYKESLPEAQAVALRRQLDFAVKVGKPVVVHSREADADSIRELGPYAEKFRAAHPGQSPGVIHCFTATRELAEATLAMGFYISFSGIITFKNAEPLREVVRDVVPIERMLVETDSPFLAPVPFRGKPNKPEHTLEVARKVAELKGMSLEDVAKITRKNTIDLFRLPL